MACGLGCPFLAPSHKATWRELFVPSSAWTKVSSCLARGRGGSPSPLPQTCFVISFFCGWHGQGKQNQSGLLFVSVSLYLLLHPWLPSERCINNCCQVPLILDVLATLSAEQWFSVQTKQHTKYENTDDYKVTILYCIFSVLNTSSLVISESH